MPKFAAGFKSGVVLLEDENDLDDLNDVLEYVVARSTPQRLFALKVLDQMHPAEEQYMFVQENDRSISVVERMPEHDEGLGKFTQTWHFQKEPDGESAYLSSFEQGGETYGASEEVPEYVERLVNRWGYEVTEK